MSNFSPLGACSDHYAATFRQHRSRGEKYCHRPIATLYPRASQGAAGGGQDKMEAAEFRKEAIKRSADVAFSLAAKLHVNLSVGC